MGYPDDATLIARGKDATLKRERRQQLERVQNICTSMMTAAHAAMRDSEKMPPESAGPILEIERCLENLKDARGKIVNLAGEIIELREVAWPE